MDTRQITPDLHVSPQIEVADVAALKEAGFRAILCNRPDGEGPGQPSYDAVAEAARAEGFEVRYLPVQSGAVTDANVADFRTALAELPTPVLAYCRSGTRCTVLWSLSQAGTRPRDEILEAARNAGYDMTPLAPRLG